LVTYQNYTKIHGPKNIKLSDMFSIRQCECSWSNTTLIMGSIIRK